MKCISKAKVDREPQWTWKTWFAWHPMRIPSDPCVPGHWVWLEFIECKGVFHFGKVKWDYRVKGS